MFSFEVHCWQQRFAYHMSLQPLQRKHPHNCESSHFYYPPDFEPCRQLMTLTVVTSNLEPSSQLSFFQVQSPSPDRDDPWRSIFHIVLRTLFFLFRLTPLMGLINIYLRPASLFSSHQRARVTPTECGRSTRNWAPLSFDTFQFVGTCEGFGVNF